MISTTRKWLRRNRTKFAVGAGVIGVGYLAGQYVVNKISEARERMTSDRIAQENLRRRFYQNQEDCTLTVLALLPTAAEHILKALPVEDITHELQQQKAERLGRNGGASDLASSETSQSPSLTGEDRRSLSSFQTDSFIHTSQASVPSNGGGSSAFLNPRKTKAQLWSDLKIGSVTRSFTLIYTLALLTLLTRIQLNLLGRRNYLSSVIALASHARHEDRINLQNNDDDRAEQSYGNDFETNRKFLTFSWWLLHRGWRSIMEKVEAAVTDVFGPLSPREELTIERLSYLLVEVRKKIEGESEEIRRSHKWLPYLLPSRDQEDFVLHELGMSFNQTPPSTASPLPSSPLVENLTTSQPELDHQPQPDSTASIPPSPSSVLLRRLLDETSDLIDSPTFTHVHTLLLDALFSHLTDTQLREQAYKLPLTNTLDQPKIEEIPPDVLGSSSKNIKLATILAIITRQAHVLGSGVPNEYVQSMEGVRELEAFAAVIFSSHSELQGFVETGAQDDSVTGADNGKLGDADNRTPSAAKRGTGAATVVEKAGEVMEGAWGVWEGVWRTVTGRGGESITG